MAKNEKRRSIKIALTKTMRARANCLDVSASVKTQLAEKVASAYALPAILRLEAADLALNYNNE